MSTNKTAAPVTKATTAETVIDKAVQAKENIEVAAALAADSMGMLPDLASLAKLPEAVIVATLKQVPLMLGLKAEAPTDEAQLLAFAKKIKDSSLNALKQGNLQDMLAEFSKSGLKVEVSLDADAMKALGVKNTASGFDWKFISKWIAGGVALVLVSYGSYKLYVKWQAGKSEAISGSNTNPGVVMLP